MASIEVLDPTVDQSGYTRAPVATQLKGTDHVQMTQIDVGNSSTIVPLVAGQTTKANSVPVTMASDDNTTVALTNLDADVGAKDDAAASTDTGTFSIIAFIKRSLQNWTTLLARIPALSGGAVPVTGTVEVANDVGNPLPVNGIVAVSTVGGTVSTNMVRGTTPTVNSISSLATSQALAAANASRLGLSIFNNSNQYLYVRYGASPPATTSDFSVAIQPGGLYEIPDRSVTLAIQGIWAAANGAAQVTEVT